MRHTVDQLLGFMRPSPFTINWNAIVAYDRKKANKVLAQEYIERFSSDSYFPPLRGEVPTTENEVEYVYDYLIDAPRLSFENSVITESVALLTMKVLGGSQFTITTEMGKRAAVTRVAAYDALQATKLTMNINLMVATGSISEGGEVILDLKQGEQPRLYFAPTLNQRQKGGAFMLSRFQAMQPTVTTFTLNEMQSQDGQFLQVKYFDIKTHAEPGAKIARAANFSEGAVLMFITMEGEANGQYPASDDDLKFLIPAGDYSSTTVLGQAFLLKRVVAEGLKAIAAGSAVTFKFNGQTGGFYTDIEVTHGEHKGAEIHLSSPSFTNIAMSGFRLPMMGKDNFSLVMIDDELLQMNWSGTADQEATITVKGGSPHPGLIVASWKFAIQFKFELEGEDGELSLKPVAASKFEQLKVAPGTFANFPTVANQFHEVATVVEPRFSDELADCVDKFVDVVTRVDAFRLNSLLFRGKNIVRFTRSNLPGDLALFGELAPEMDVFEIAPQEHVIGQGAKFKFTVVPAQSVTWEVIKIEGYTGFAGAIDRLGEYTAPVKSELESAGLHFLRVKIKATGAGANPGVAYAMITIVTAPISINPLIQVCNASDGTTLQKREMAAGALAAGELTWRIAGNTGSHIEDSIIDQGDHTYVARPKETTLPTAYSLDQVVVSDTGGNSDSSWVLVVHKDVIGQIRIEDSPSLPPGSVKFVAFTDKGDLLGVTWTLLKGNGEINSVTGVYTSNVNGPYRFALITAYKEGDFVDINCHFILPLPIIDLPILLNVLDKADVYFKSVARLGMDEAARAAGLDFE